MKQNGSVFRISEWNEAKEEKLKSLIMPIPRITMLVVVSCFFVHILEFLKILLFREIVALYWYF